MTWPLSGVFFPPFLGHTAPSAQTTYQRFRCILCDRTWLCCPGELVGQVLFYPDGSDPDASEPSHVCFGGLGCSCGGGVVLAGRDVAPTKNGGLVRLG